MQVSPKRHPLAVLRLMLGWQQKEMADKLKVSRQTIQRIELGTLPLTERLASLVSAFTGVSYEWLMAGDPKATPIVKGGFRAEYTKEHFEKHRARLLNPDRTDPVIFVLNRVPLVAVQLLATFSRIAADGKISRAELAMFKIVSALQELAAEFCPHAHAEEFPSRVYDELIHTMGDALKDQIELRKALSKMPPSKGFKRAVPPAKAKSKTNQKRR